MTIRKLSIRKNFATTGEKIINTKEEIPAKIKTKRANELYIEYTSPFPFAEEINFTIEMLAEDGTTLIRYKMENILAKTP